MTKVPPPILQKIPYIVSFYPPLSHFHYSEPDIFWGVLLPRQAIGCDVEAKAKKPVTRNAR